jgi:hypothetical protein
MRGILGLLGTAMAFLLLFTACAKPEYVCTVHRPAYYEVPNKSESYIKKAVISIKPDAPTYLGHQAEDFLLQTLTDTIRKNSHRLNLVAPGDAEYPAFMKVYHPISMQDVFFVTQTARQQGYHCVLQAAVENIRVHDEKTGMLWFRKTRYFMTVVVSLDVFDTFTGAKISGNVLEHSVKIDPSIYADFLAGSPDAVQTVQALVTDMAKDLGERAADAVADCKWVTSVVRVGNPHISLTSGASSGLRVGDRLSIFEGRRIIDGQDGEKFIVPGYKVGDVQITAIDKNSAQASSVGACDIRPGDIAVPAM